MPIKFEFKSAGIAFLVGFGVLLAVIAFAPRETTNLDVVAARKQIEDLGVILTPYFDLCNRPTPQPVPVRAILEDNCFHDVVDKLPAMKSLLEPETMKSAATDPWGNEIYFQRKDDGIYLMSWGSDHKGGGVGSAADIVKKVR